jgi:hypothetical protein
MATYRQIQDDIRERHGRLVKTCWIAHVKELHGLHPRVAPNRISPSERQAPCPPEWQPVIEESMRRFGMIPERARRAAGT